MKKQADQFKKIVAHCKEYGYIFPSSEIYDGLSASYDYGPYGVELKNNIKNYWWKAMVQMHDNIVGLDAAIFMHPKVWKASGHVDAFNDPMIDNKDSKKRYRADNLIEDYMGKIDAKIQKEVDKAKKRFGDAFDEEEFKATNPRVKNNVEKRTALSKRYVLALENNNLEELKTIIEECGIADPETGSKNWTEVRQFNLMFSMQFGALASDAENSKVYLRPETAQGIFVNFLNVQKSTRQKLPFGIAQIGKAFRNEIVARQFIFRMREFEQMEMQFFVKPGAEMEWYEYWKNFRMKWHETIFPANKLKFHNHEKLAHYANAAVDIEFEFPFGFKELEGIHSRTDFDLSSHEKHSGKKLQYFDPELNKNYVPFVVETSIGLDRMFLAIFSNSLVEETLEDGSTRTVLRLPYFLAPVKAAILPLLKKDGLPEVARKIVDDLKFEYNVQYDEKDAIGKRYRRQDAAGTPICITVDHDSLTDDSVTIRHRDSMQQERVAISKLKEILGGLVKMESYLKKLN